MSRFHDEIDMLCFKLGLEWTRSFLNTFVGCNTCFFVSENIGYPARDLRCPMIKRCFFCCFLFSWVGSSHYHSEIHQHNELIHVIMYIYIYTCISKSGRYMCTYRDIIIAVYCILNLEI